ncbi:MAG: sulfatase [Ferruginibacter sp.]
MKRSSIYYFFLIGLLPLEISNAHLHKIYEENKPPNIVIIFMDDMGYGDPECYGGFPYHTPHINAMAAAGMRFTNYYAAQGVCTASRAGLLTGCYPNRVGLSGALFPWSEIALNNEEETVAELLKQKGYATGMAGKWHLGQKEPYLPLQQGFDEWLGLPYSNDMWPVDYDGKPVNEAHAKFRFPPLPLMEGNIKKREINTIDDQAKLTKMFTERAVDFIKRNKSRPFFFYLAHSMPHVPIAASEKFKGKSRGGLFGDTMEEIDWSVGEVIRTLDENHLSENTLVIFASDNGPWLTYGDHAGSTGGFREGKGTVWEGGVRVPCIMRWKGKIAAGSVCNNMVAALDILPTLVTICKTKNPVKKIDGVNILPLIMQQANANPRDEFIYYYNVNSLKAVRKGKWKLVFPHVSQTYKKTLPGKDGWPGEYASDSVKLSLYDLSTDPGETLDRKALNPGVVEELSALAERYRNELGDDLTQRKGTAVRPAAKVK